MLYRIEITLPTIQELIAASCGVYCNTSLPEDMDVTQQLVEAGKLLDIDVLDHLIIGNPRYVSLKQKINW